MLGWNWEEDMEKLDSLLAFVKSEVKFYNRQDDVLSIELKDTNRPDLWSVEGLSRTLRGFLKKDKGLKRYEVGKPLLKVNVDARLNKIRPFICCSVVKNVKLTDAIIRGLMHMQDKLDQTYGRNRQKTSIGIYDYDLISPPLSYTVAKPNEISFVPLGVEENISLAEILEKHPKGVEYGHIVKDYKLYPILMDSNLKVLSFPPIINSNDLGRVTETTKNLLVEVTGTLHQTVLDTLNLVTLALIDRGGQAYAATVHYPSGASNALGKVVTPNFSSKKMELVVSYANKVLGLQLTPEYITDLLSVAGFGVKKVEGETIELQVPCYRVDMMHQVDLVEEIAIAHGYNRIKPLWRDLPTTGSARPEQRLIDTAKEVMVGLGFQEILAYTLTNSENLFNKMFCKPTPTAEVANPKVMTMTCLRSWLLPSLMEFFENNKSVEFPQRIFELGKVTILDETMETRTRDEEWLAAATAHPTACFSEIKSDLDAFFMNFDIDWEIRETNHPTFIDGRVGYALVKGNIVGFLGEVSPKVLEAWKLENPVAALEINIHKIINNKLAKKNE